MGRGSFCFFCHPPLTKSVSPYSSLHGSHNARRLCYLLLSLDPLPLLRNTRSRIYVRPYERRLGYVRAKIDIISDAQITNYTRKRWVHESKHCSIAITTCKYSVGRHNRVVSVRTDESCRVCAWVGVTWMFRVLIVSVQGAVRDVITKTVRLVQTAIITLPAAGFHTNERKTTRRRVAFGWNGDEFFNHDL